MKLRRLGFFFLLLLLLTAPAWAQKSHYHGSVIDSGGRPVSQAQIQVYLQGTATPATLYLDRGGTPGTNPDTADTKGNYDFYIDAGTYDLFYLKNAVTVGFLLDVDIGTGGGGTGGTLPVFLVTSFGATCDGSDETTEIQATVDAAEISGGVVEFPAGTCAFGNVNPGASNIHFRGQGRGTTVLKLRNSAPSNLFNIGTGGLSNISFEDLEFDMNSSGAPAGVRAIYARDITSFRVSNCYFHDAVNGFIWIDWVSTGGSKIEILHSEFENWDTNSDDQEAVRIDRHTEVRVIGNYAHDAPNAGGSGNAGAFHIGGSGTQSGPVHDVVVTGNLIENVGATTPGTNARGILVSGTTSTQCTGVTVSGNEVRDVDDDSISIVNCDYVAVSGNTVIHPREVGISGVSVRYASYTGNAIIGGTENGHGIDISSAGSGIAPIEVVVDSNTVIDTDPTNVFTNSSAINISGINALSGTIRDITVSNNVIFFNTTGMAEYGIRVFASDADADINGVVLSGNTVRNAGTNGIFLGNQGADTDPNITNVRIEGNVVKDSGAADLFVTKFSQGIVILGTNDFGDSPTQGLATLSAGTVTIPTAAAHAGQQILAFRLGASLANAGFLSQGTVTPQVEFAIESSDSSDNDGIFWFMAR